MTRKIKFRFYSNADKKMYNDLSLIGLHYSYEDNPSVYEGDILKGHYWFNGEKRRFIGQVVYGGHGFVQKGVKQYYGMNQDFSPLNEVIGNIYENPGLLTIEGKELSD